MRKLLIPVAATAAAAGGAAALWLGPAFAGAQTSSTTSPSTVPGSTATAPKDGPLERALAKLVTDGTLTQAQADKVLAALKAELPARGPGGPGGFGFEHHGPDGAGLDAASGYLGMTDAELRTALEGGKTLADVAKDKGKSVSGLVDALVKEASDHLATEVTEGDLTQAQADKIKGDLKTKITDMVNNPLPPKPEGGFGMRGHRGGPGPWGPPPAAPSSGTAAA